MVAFSDVECRRQQLTDGLAIGVTLTPTPGLENLGLQTPNPVQKNLDSDSDYGTNISLQLRL